jgi:hypothetical protein
MQYLLSVLMSFCELHHPARGVVAAALLTVRKKEVLYLFPIGCELTDRLSDGVRAIGLSLTTTAWKMCASAFN